MEVTISEPDVEARKLDLEREKWQAEKAFREREIGLKEREQTLTSWTNPLTVAVAVAAVAWVGNVIATSWSSRMQRVLEEEKARQQLQLEGSKAESERILEMIKTGDPDKAASNLEFLLDAGLIVSDDRVARLRDYLAKRRPGSGPALPVAGSRFSLEQTEALTASVAARLDADLQAFIAYLDHVGFPTPAERVRIKVERLSAPNASYDPENKLISIDDRIIGDAYTVHREYMHHLLFASKPNYEWESSIGDLENALADYFSASFTGDPVLGTSGARALGLDRDYIRRLDNTRTYTPRVGTEQPHDRGEMLGAAFWDIRAKLGQDVTDRALSMGWRSMPWPLADAEIVPGFVKALLAAIEAEPGPTRSPAVVAVLRLRKIPITH